MTTISQIITDAYQYNNIIALNTIPSAAEQAKALRDFNRIFRSMLGNELGESLQSFNLSTYCLRGNDSIPYLASNKRLIITAESPATFSLPKLPQDGCRFSIQDAAQQFDVAPFTLFASGRLIENSPFLVLTTKGYSGEWFFRQDLGNWVSIHDFVLSDDFPLPAEFEEFFIAALAVRHGASEGVDLSNSLAYIMKDVSRKFKSRYRQTHEVGADLGLLNLTGSYNRETNFYYG